MVYIRHAPYWIVALCFVGLSVWAAWIWSACARPVPFSEFVNNLRGAKASSYVGQPGFSVQNAVAFEEMRQYLLQLYNNVSVAHSFVSDHQVFDCIPTNQEPSVRAQGSSAPIRPPQPLPPPDTSGSMPITVTTNVSDKETCPDGTVPMRRVTLEEMARFPNLHQFFQK